MMNGTITITRFGHEYTLVKVHRGVNEPEANFLGYAGYALQSCKKIKKRKEDKK